MKRRLILIPLLLFVCTARSVTVTGFDPVGSQVYQADHEIYTVDWCGCELLAVGGLGSEEGLIQTYSFDPINPGDLISTGSTTITGVDIYSVKWCDSCRYLAAGGNNYSDEVGAVLLYSFDPEVANSLELMQSKTVGSITLSVDWCNECEYLAAGGYSDDDHLLLQLYQFDAAKTGSELSEVGDLYIDATKSGIQSLKWCNNCSYIAVVGYLYISILSFDPEQPELGVQSFASLSPNQRVLSVDWCDDCTHFAVNGYDYDLQKSFIAVYEFNPDATQKFSLVDSTTLPAICKVNSGTLQWCGCNNLAVGEYIEVSGNPVICIVELYHFDGTALELQQTLLVEPPNNKKLAIDSVAWCGNCDYLAIGGGEDLYPGFIQVFRANQSVVQAPTVRAQKNSYRFPTQLDIVNTLCWEAVSNAVSYNVYADSSKVVRLAHITQAPYCYSQHQIIPNTPKTYYVTSIDAEGSESEFTVVTIS